MHYQIPSPSVGTAASDLGLVPVDAEANNKKAISVNAAKLIPQVASVQSMRRCSKYSTCSATLCPLDPCWALRVAKAGDPTCTWFLEMAKEGPESQYVPEELREEVAQALATMQASTGAAALRVAMRRASKCGSRRRIAFELLAAEAGDS